MDLRPAPDRVVNAASLGRDLVSGTAYAMARRSADQGVGRSPAAEPRSASTLLTAERLRTVDVDAVAGWMVDQYPVRRYPGVVIGSPHGASAHLAAALDMPYLPSSFDIEVAWPAGAADNVAGALRFGTDQALRLLSVNPTPVSVRQVHEPANRTRRAGWPVHLVVRWLGLPAAYRGFLERSLEVGGAVLLVSDAREWPVIQLGMGIGFQVGAAASGLRAADYAAGSEVAAAMICAAGGEPDLWDPPDAAPRRPAEHGMEPAFALRVRQWAHRAGSTVQRVLYSRPDAWSAAVAEVYRAWFARSGPPAAHCVVECGRQLDLWSVLRRGTVPYWCENATRDSVAAAEWWLAGSPSFRSVDVVPESPGLALRPYATLRQWASVASFSGQRGLLNRAAAGAYPHRPSPPGLVTQMLTRQPPRDHPTPTLGFALEALAAGPGLLISPPTR